MGCLITEYTHKGVFQVYVLGQKMGCVCVQHAQMCSPAHCSLLQTFLLEKNTWDLLPGQT